MGLSSPMLKKRLIFHDGTFQAQIILKKRSKESLIFLEIELFSLKLKKIQEGTLKFQA